jgi:hypothetical protein
MTADEIRATHETSHDWLQEIAAQLAELNEQLHSVIYTERDPVTKEKNPINMFGPPMIRVNR